MHRARPDGRQTAAALKTIDLSGLTMTHAQGRGRHPHAPMLWRGCEHEAFLPNVTIDMVVPTTWLTT